MKKFNIFYKERKIYTNLSIEDCTEIIQNLSERFYSEENFDPNFIKMEEI
jgi:(2Fe-2S) ferredoxin